MAGARITFKYSSDVEARLLVESYLYARDGFYTKNGFYVFDKLKKDVDQKIIIIPSDIDYKKLYMLTKESHFDFDKSTIVHKKKLKNGEDYILKYIKKLEPIKPLAGKKDIGYIKSAVDRFSSIPLFKDKTFDIQVYYKRFGSCGSFRMLDNEDIRSSIVKIQVELRVDQPIKSVVDLVSLSLTKPLAIELGAKNWREKKIVSDFVTKYILNTNKLTSPLISLNSGSLGLQRDSLSYMQNRGISKFKPLTIDNAGNIYALESNITKRLSSYEYITLKTLLTNSKETTTFDDLAKALYDNNAEVNFSLWGINKTIQRVREKIDKYGVPKQTIKNVKGVGFILVV